MTEGRLIRRKWPSEPLPHQCRPPVYALRCLLRLREGAIWECGCKKRWTLYWHGAADAGNWRWESSEIRYD